jgi:SNF2 family DNA or RNA helicase
VIFRPYPYQERAKEHVIKNKACGLFLDMGLGKTVVALTAIEELMYDYFEIRKALVVAPLKTAESVWAQEAAKWDHLRGLRVAKVLGTAKARERALGERADVFVVNRDNVSWLVELLGSRWPFDMVVLDELSSFKSPSSKRFRALRSVRRRMARVVGLTGTPAPNGLIDLWPQIYLLDQGERLGRHVTGFRRDYFTAARSSGRAVFSWRPLPGAAEAIYRRIADICVSMKASDYLQLPGRVDNVVKVPLPASASARCKELERLYVSALPEGEVTAANAAVLSGKLLQLANGAVYVDGGAGAWAEVHRAKLDALSELAEACGQPLLVFYAFKHDRERILESLASLGPRLLDGPGDVEDWNAGRIRALLAHPASAGHGLNLQAGGNLIVWFGLTWSLELYQQANARLHRQGQERPVIIHHLVSEGTIDEDVMKALKKKDKTQAELLEAVRARAGALARGEGKA